MQWSFRFALVSFFLNFCAANAVQAMLVPITPERVSWEITGTIGEVGTLLGSPVPVSEGELFSIEFVFELDSMFEQCSPCVGTGDIQWRGRITEFSAEIAGLEFTADIGARFANFVLFQPGDDPTEVDYISIRLGNRQYDRHREPVPLTYEGGVLDAAFTFYMADFTGGLFDEDEGPWRRSLTLPTPASSTDTTLFIDRRPRESDYTGAILDLDLQAVTPVPEPGVLPLFVLGVLCVRVTLKRGVTR